MTKKILHIITLALIVTFVSVQTEAQPSVYKIKRMPFNYNGFNNISPVIVKDGIVFCSDRRFSGIKDRTGYDGSRLYNIYFAEKKDTSTYRKSRVIKSERSNKFNSGPLCFGPDGKTVYFTSEVETGKNAGNKNFKNHSGIFTAELSGTDLISIQPFKFNDPQFTVGQPSISNDGKSLFFASDMPGGHGGSDIYYCSLIDGNWSAPANLGPLVNSASSENYPYRHPSGKLYFSSNRPGGIGKLDVYFTSMRDGIWEIPLLLPEPINSKADDFAFVAEDDMQKGYFSSNRSKGDNIYEFKSNIMRNASCDTLLANNYCYRFFEVNAVRYGNIPFRFEWKFGDGTKATGAVVEHCFNGPGTYVVQLDVKNLISGKVTINEKSETLVLSEIEQPYITAPDRIGTNQSVVLSADSTNLPGWDISQYYWNFGDETIGVGKDIEKRFTKSGSYNIQLTVSTKPEPGVNAKEACISKNIIVFRQP